MKLSPCLEKLVWRIKLIWTFTWLSEPGAINDLSQQLDRPALSASLSLWSQGSLLTLISFICLHKLSMWLLYLCLCWIIDNNIYFAHTLIKFWRYNKVNLAISAFCRTLAQTKSNVKQVSDSRLFPDIPM